MLYLQGDRSVGLAQPVGGENESRQSSTAEKHRRECLLYT